MVGGKSAHSPRTSKILTKKINEKERKIALASSLALASSREAVEARGHILPEDVSLPVVLEDKVEKITKTKDAEKLLEELGLLDDVNRAKEGRKIRAGRGKMRHRRYKQPRSILFVGKTYESFRAFRSLPGVELATPETMSIKKLAPGGNAGRLIVFTEGAMKELKKRGK